MFIIVLLDHFTVEILSLPYLFELIPESPVFFQYCLDFVGLVSDRFSEIADRALEVRHASNKRHHIQLSLGICLG